MLAEALRILIVEARMYAAVADDLLSGARAGLGAANCEFDVISVPGALEIPAVIAMAEEDGHRPAGVRYDGYVALGCVVRGGGAWFEIVAGQCARGLMDLAVGRRLAIGHGVLAVESEAEGVEMARTDGGDTGGAAARACLAVIDARRRLLGQIR